MPGEWWKNDAILAAMTHFAVNALGGVPMCDAAEAHMARIATTGAVQ